MTVDQMKSQRKQKKGQFNAFVNRRNALNTIIGNIDSKLGDDISDVNSKINKCANELSSAVKGSGRPSSLANQMAAQKESNPDGKISDCRSYLVSERSRCQNQINTLSCEITRLEQQIKEAGGTLYPWE